MKLLRVKKKSRSVQKAEHLLEHSTKVLCCQIWFGNVSEISFRCDSRSNKSLTNNTDTSRTTGFQNQERSS